MKHHLLTLLLIAVFVLSASAQTPGPSPTPAGESDVVKISTNLIQVDVSVTDSKGKPIRDLRADEIEIYENGKKQDISNFSFVSRESETATEGVRGTEKSSEVLILPGRPPAPESVRRTIALVVDDLSLSFASMYWVKSALKKYVNENVQDGDLVALIRTGGGVGSQQQFTMDKRRLIAAIEKLKFNMSGNGSVSGSFAPITPTLLEQVADSKVGQRDHRADIEKQRAIENQLTDFRSSVFVNGTLGAVNFIVSGMAELPGRKSIVLLSDGISLVSRDGRGVPQGSTTVLDSLKRLIEFANRSSVVIYTIDGRGLEVPGPRAHDDWTAAGYAQALAERDQRFRDSQDGLRYLAYETGGFAFVNQNNINEGLRRVMDDQSYYLIGYQPDSDTFDPKANRFNRLEVKVSRPGAKIRYRSGFFGVTDEQVAANSRSRLNTVAGALASPFASNDIPLRLHTLFTTGDKGQLWVKSFLHIDPAALEFRQEPDGRRRSTFEIVAVSFGDNGIPTDQFKHSFKMSVDADTYTKGLEKGLVYQFAFPVKKAGAYQYRVALRDTGTNKIGTAFQFIEVPDVGKKRLTLSGVAVENIPGSIWKRTGGAGAASSDPERDTALRQFRQGSVMRYVADVYNPDTKVPLTGKMRIFRDGKIHFEGKETPIAVSAGSSGIQYTGGMTLGADMPPGEYVLQLVVSQPKGKEIRSAVQFVEFEIVD